MSARVSTTSDRAVLPWRTFGPILAVHLFGTLGFSLAIPFLVFIVDDLGGATWTYGLLGATYSAFQLVGAPVLGRWSDHTGRRPVLVASQAGTLAAWMLFLVALSLPVQGVVQIAGATLTLPLLLVFAARALDGATGGNISVANAYVADLTRNTPQLRHVAFGRMGMAASMGFVIGPAAAGLLGGTSWGPRLPIAIAAMMAMVTTLAIVVWLREPGGRCPEGPEEPTALETGLNQQTKPCDQAPPPPILLATLRRGPMTSVLVATFAVFLGFNLFYAGFPVHAMESLRMGYRTAWSFLCTAQRHDDRRSGSSADVLSRHLSRRIVFGAGMACLVLSLLSLVLPAGYLTYVGAALFALGNGLSWPTFQARVAEVAGDAQGAIQGAATSASSLASISGLVAGGVLYPVLQSDLFYVAAALFAFVFLLTPVWFPHARQT